MFCIDQKAFRHDDDEGAKTKTTYPGKSAPLDWLKSFSRSFLLHSITISNLFRTRDKKKKNNNNKKLNSNSNVRTAAGEAYGKMFTIIAVFTL